MKNISNEIISIEEAKAALRCMRLSGLSEEEGLESLESFAIRLRKVTTSRLVHDIIETKLTDTQRVFFKEYWYSGKNTAQIAREYGVSQANVYRTVTRANETVRELMTYVIRYQYDLEDASIVPLRTREIIEICAAENSTDRTLCGGLKNLRIASAVSADELADALKLSTKELEQTERGKKIPSLNLLKRYSAVLGADIKIEFINGRSIYECKRA